MAFDPLPNEITRQGDVLVLDRGAQRLEPVVDLRVQRWTAAIDIGAFRRGADIVGRPLVPEGDAVRGIVAGLRYRVTVGHEDHVALDLRAAGREGILRGEYARSAT